MPQPKVDNSKVDKAFEAWKASQEGTVAPSPVAAPVAQPKQPLQGKAEFNVGQMAADFGLGLPAGLSETGENLGNFAVGLPQMAIPQDQRKNLSELLPGFKPTQQLEQAPMFQEAAQRPSALPFNAYQAGKFAGGFAIPVGGLTGIGQVASRIPQLAPILGAVAKVAAPVTSAVSKALSAVPARVGKIPLQSMARLGAKQIPAGAALGGANTGGAEFAKNKQISALPTLGGAAAGAAMAPLAGGAVALAGRAAGKGIGKVLNRKQRAKAEEVAAQASAESKVGAPLTPEEKQIVFGPTGQFYPKEYQLQALQTLAANFPERAPQYTLVANELQQSAAMIKPPIELPKQRPLSVDELADLATHKTPEARRNYLATLQYDEAGNPSDVYTAASRRFEQAMKEESNQAAKQGQAVQKTVEKEIGIARKEIAKSKQNVQNLTQKEIDLARKAKEKEKAIAQKTSEKQQVKQEKAQQEQNKGVQRATEKQMTRAEKEIEAKKRAQRDKERLAERNQADLSKVKDAAGQVDRLKGMFEQANDEDSYNAALKQYGLIYRNLTQPLKEIVNNAKAGAVERMQGKGQRETEPGLVSQEETPIQKLSNKIALFRKTLAVDKRFAEKRYELGATAQAVAKEYNLRPEEAVALSKMSSTLAMHTVDRVLAEKELKALVEWAMNNETRWNPRKDVEALKKTTLDENGLPTVTLELKEKAAKVGAVRLLSLVYKEELSLDYETSNKIILHRYNLIQKGLEEGVFDGTEIQTNRGGVNTTFGGVIKNGEYKTDANGKPEIGAFEVKPIKGFVDNPPKNFDQLYDRIRELQGRIAFNNADAKAIREGKGSYAAPEFFGGMNKLASDMFASKETEIKKLLSLPIEELQKKLPAININEVVKAGGKKYIATIRYDQDSMQFPFKRLLKGSVEGQDLLEAQLQYEQQIKTEKGKAKGDFFAKLPKITPAMALGDPITTMSFLGLATKVTGQQLARMLNSKKLPFSLSNMNTIRRIMMSRTEHEGDKLYLQFERLRVQQSRTMRQNPNKYHRFGSEPEKVEFLTKTRGKTPGYIEGHATEFGMTQKQANTIALEKEVRNQAAKALEPALKKWAARARDHRDGSISQESQYLSHEIINGKPKASAYDAGFHEAMKVFYDNLKLRRKNEPHASRVLQRAATSINQARFAGNLRNAEANFFDPIPVLLPEFGRHLLGAIQDVGMMTGDTKIQKALREMPWFRLSDAGRVRELVERHSKGAHGDSWFDKLLEVRDKIADDLTTGGPLQKLPIVGPAMKNLQGNDIVSSLPELYYSSIVFTASLRQLAGINKKNPSAFVKDFFGGKLSEREAFEAESYANGQISKFLNTIDPTTNVDTLDEVAVLRAAMPYSRPMRRAFTIMNDWLAEGSKESLTKFAGAATMLVVLGGPKGIPFSVRTAMALFTPALLMTMDAGLKALPSLDEYVHIGERIAPDPMNLASEGTIMSIDAVADILRSSLKVVKEPSLESVAPPLVTASILAGISRVGPIGLSVLLSYYKSFADAEKGAKSFYYRSPFSPFPQKVTIPWDFEDAVTFPVMLGTPDEVYKIQTAKEQASLSKQQGKVDMFWEKIGDMVKPKNALPEKKKSIPGET